MKGAAMILQQGSDVQDPPSSTLTEVGLDFHWQPHLTIGD
jgi:hypothetical protein